MSENKFERMSRLEKEKLFLVLREKKVRSARENYAEYLEFVHNGDYKHALHTRFIAEILNGAIELKKVSEKRQYFIFSLPPRHGKSMSITESLPSYFLGHFPKQKVILASYGDDLSKRFSKRNLQKVQEYGKELFNIELENKNIENWELKQGGMLISRGVMSGITGQGADLLIIDDPIKTRAEANSETYRNSLWAEWQDSLSTRLHKNSIVIIIMTRWHEDDLVGRLLNPEYGEPLPWQYINLPLEAEDNDILGRERGEPLWGDMYGYEFIAERKTYPQSFNALFQGRPTSEEGNIIKRASWQYYNKTDVFIESLPQIVLSVDASFKDGKRNDNCSLQVWGKKGADYYLVDNVTRKMGFTETLQNIKNLLVKYPKIRAKFVEDKANGSAIIDVLNRQIGGFIPVSADAQTGGKVARVYAVEPYITSGNVYLPRGEEWLGEFVEEFASFPNGKNDDQVDCASQALNKLIYYQAEVIKHTPIDRFLVGEEEERDVYDVLQGEISQSFIDY